MHNKALNWKKIFIYVIIPFIFLITDAFIFIKIIENLSYRLSFDLSKDGWVLFINIFNVPLQLLWKFILTYGIIIAIYRLIIADRQLKLNEMALKADTRPFIIFKNFQYNKNKKQFEFSLTNFGKHPARIISVHFDYKELTKNRMATFKRDYYVILKDEIKTDYIELKHDKPSIVESWFINKESTGVYITTHYMGLYDLNFYTKEIWKLNIEKEQFEIIFSEWI